MKGVEPWLQTHWDWRAAGNFICGGTGTGLLLFAAVSAMEGRPSRLLTFAGLLSVCLGLMLVWAELGRPWRFLHVFFHPRTSWMTREAIVSIPLVGVAAGAAWFPLSGLTIAAAAIGLLFLYCQGRMLRAAKGIPVWRIRSIVPLIVSTGLTEGAAAAALLQTAVTAQASDTIVIAFLCLAAVRSLTWRYYRVKLAAEGAPIKALKVIDTFHPLFDYGGNVLPIVLLGAGLLVYDATIILTPIAGLSALALGWRLKYVIITRASYNQGYALTKTPARGGAKGVKVKPGW